MTRQRANLFQQDEKEGDLDLAEFAPRPSPLNDPPGALRAAGEVGGFRTRHAVEPTTLPEEPRDGRSLRRTGRSAQFNIAVTPEAKARFWKLARAAGVRAGGEFFEQLLNEWEKQGRGG